MIEIKDGGTYAVKERVNVEGAAAPIASTGTEPAKAANQ
jgi:hypothetical protein